MLVLLFILVNEELFLSWIVLFSHSSNRLLFIGEIHLARLW